MIFAALDEAASKGELLITEHGLCRFHKRRDGIVVIREIVVLPRSRLHGIGKYLVERVQSIHPGLPLRAKCPASLPSNGFWAKMGFAMTEGGKINTWERQPSSTAPVVTLNVLT